MKKNYTAVEITVILLYCEDILTTSGGFTVSNINDLNSENKASFDELFNN